MKDKPVILVVDDQPENIDLLEAYLVPQGYEIVKAANGEEALGKLSGNQIDLILLDIMMPGMDGFEVTRRVRQNNTHRLLPIILVTVLRETEDRVKGIESGCDDFISYPVDKMELLARVRSLLRIKASNDLMSNYQKELESEVTRKTEELNQALENLQQDITERKQAEEALKKNQAQLSNALEIAHLGHWEYDVAADLFTFNDQFYRMFRTTVEEVDGYIMHSAEYAHRFVHPDDTHMVGEEIRKAIESTDPQFNRQLEHKILYADGKVGYITVRFFIVKDSDGRTVKTYGVNQDITERKTSEQELRESEERLRLTHKATNDVVWDWDVINDAQKWNEAGKVVFGWTDIVERPQTAHWWVERVHPEDLQRVSDGFFAVVNNPEVDYWQDEYRFRKADGSYAQVLDRGYVLRDKQGKSLRMIGAMLDITERKQAEEQIRASLREKEVMLKEIHHRVKNNLMVIQSLLNLQAAKIEDPQVKEILLVSQNRIWAMALVHEELYKSPDFSYIDFSDYLQNLSTRLFQSLRIRRDKVDLKLEVEKVRLGIDQSIPVGLIISELISNALKHAFPGDMEGEIQVKLALIDGGMIQLTVSDSGIGFPSEVDFRKIGSLGFQVVMALVMQLKGSIEIDRQGGTEFRITFPKGEVG